jgi:hypothetical protein
MEFVVADGLVAGSSTGIAAAEQRWIEFRGDWEDFQIDADEYRCSRRGLDARLHRQCSCLLDGRAAPRND